MGCDDRSSWRGRMLALPLVLVSSCVNTDPSLEEVLGPRQPLPAGSSPSEEEIQRRVEIEAQYHAHKVEEARRLLERPAHDPVATVGEAAQGEFESWDDYVARLAALSHDGYFQFAVDVQSDRYDINQERWEIVFPGLFSAVDQELRVPLKDQLEGRDLEGENVFGARARIRLEEGEIFSLSVVNWVDLARGDDRLVNDGYWGEPTLHARVDPALAERSKESLGLRFVVSLWDGPRQEYLEQDATFRNRTAVSAVFHRLPVELEMILVHDTRTGELLDVIPKPLGGAR